MYSLKLLCRKVRTKKEKWRTRGIDSQMNRYRLFNSSYLWALTDQFFHKIIFVMILIVQNVSSTYLTVVGVSILTLFAIINPMSSKRKRSHSSCDNMHVHFLFHVKTTTTTNKHKQKHSHNTDIPRC